MIENLNSLGSNRENVFYLSGIKESEHSYQSLIEKIKREKKEEYNNKIYTSNVEIKAKEHLNILVYYNWNKENHDYKFKSNFAGFELKRDQTIIITRMEYEINERMHPDFEKNVILRSVPLEAAA